MKDMFIIASKHNHTFTCNVCEKEMTQGGWRDVSLNVFSMRLMWSHIHWFCSYECFMKKPDRILAYFEQKPNLNTLANTGRLADAMNVAAQYYHGISHPKKAFYTLSRYDLGKLLKEDEDTYYKTLRHVVHMLSTVWPKELIHISLSYYGLSHM